MANLKKTPASSQMKHEAAVQVLLTSKYSSSYFPPLKYEALHNCFMFTILNMFLLAQLTRLPDVLSLVIFS